MPSFTVVRIREARVLAVGAERACLGQVLGYDDSIIGDTVCTYVELSVKVVWILLYIHVS